MRESNKRSVLKDHGDFLADCLQLLFGVVGNVLAGDDDASGVRFEKAHDVMQRDRFAHAAAAQDADGFAGQDVEADAIEHDVVAEGFGDFVEFDVGINSIGHRLMITH